MKNLLVKARPSPLLVGMSFTLDDGYCFQCMRSFAGAQDDKLGEDDWAQGMNKGERIRGLRSALRSSR